MKKFAKLVLFVFLVTIVLSVVRAITIGVGMNVLLRNLLSVGLFFLIASMFGYFKKSKQNDK